MKKILILINLIIACSLLYAGEEGAAVAEAESMPAISGAERDSLLDEAEKYELRGERYSAQTEYESALAAVMQRISDNKEPEYNSALAEFVIEKILEISSFTCENAQALESLQHAVAGKDLLAFLRRRVDMAQIELYMRLGEGGKAGEVAASAGVVRDWFFNLYSENNESKGSIGAGVFHKITSPSGVVEPDVFINDSRLHSLIASTVIVNSSDKPVEVSLKVDSRSAFKLSVNGIEAAGDNIYRERLEEVKVVSFSIKPGKSLVQLKFPAEREKETAFRVCLYVSEAELKKQLTFLEKAQLVEEAIKTLSTDKPAMLRTNLQVLTVDPGASRIFASLVKVNVKDYRAAYYLGYLLSRRQLLGRHSTAPGQLLMQAAKGDKSSGIYFLALARANDQSGRARPDRDENMRRLSLQKVIEIMPESVSALTDLARYYMDSVGSLEKADNFLKLALKNNPQSVEANLALADLYRKRGWGARAYSLLAEVAKRNPVIGKLRLFEGELALQFSQVGLALDSMEQAYKSDRTDIGAFTRYAGQLHSSGKSDNWLAAVNSYRTLFPYDVAPLVDLIEYYLRENDFIKAQEYLAVLGGINSESGDFLRLSGNLAQLKGDEKKALEYYKKANQADTSDVSLRDYLAYKGVTEPSPLTDIASIADYAGEFSYFKAQPGDERVYLLDEQVDELYADTTKSRSHNSVIRILDDTGAQKTRRTPIWYDGEYEDVKVLLAQVHHTNGTSSTAQTVPISRSGDKQVVLVVFPALVKGDIVELKYTISQLKPDFFGEYFGDIHIFKKFDPVLRARYVLITPKKRDIYFHILNGAPEPKVDKDGDKVVRSWQMSNLESMAAEPFMPRLAALSPVVQVSTFKDWDTLAKWYWNLIKDQNITNAEISEKVKELTAGVQTDREKLAAIYDWVIKNVRNNAWEFGVHGYKPYNAGAIFTRRFGDCKDKATLINVMAREAGIDAWPLLLRSVDPSEPASGRTAEDLSLPLLTHFNHCISVADIAGKKYYLDGTMQFQTLDSLPFTDTGAEAVIIRPQGAERVSLPAHVPETNSWLGTSSIKIASTGNTDFEFGFQGTGQVSVFLRSWFRNPQSWDNVLRAIATQKLGPVMAVVVDDVVLDGEKSESATFQGRVRIKEYAKKEGDNIVFKIPAPLLGGVYGKDGAVPEKLMDFATDSARSTELVLPSLFNLNRQIRVEWPEGWELAEKFENREFSADFGELKVKYSLTANIMEFDFQMKLKKMVISVEEYSEFRRFCQMVDRICDYSYTLERK